MFKIHDVVQFTEKHKWCGCLGPISKIKPCGDDIKYLVGVQVPQGGIAYIFTMQSDNDIEYIGEAVIVTVEEDEDDI